MKTMQEPIVFRYEDLFLSFRNKDVTESDIGKLVAHRINLNVISVKELTSDDFPKGMVYEIDARVFKVRVFRELKFYPDTIK
jgi:hypothetical protein